MKALHLNQPLPPLTGIGSVSQLGSEVIAGDPQASVALIHGAPDDNLSCGLFACTPGEFTMIYPFTEHATVLEGRVQLTDEASGETQTYGPGDSWLVEKGTAVRWRIEGQRFVKHYLAVVNG